MSLLLEVLGSGGAVETDTTIRPAGDEDAQLTRRIARGDAAAFDLLYRRISLRLQHIAFQVCGDRAEAADIVHDVFVFLWGKARLFDSGRGSVLSWLAAATRNRAIDFVRARKRHTVLLGENCIDGDVFEAPETFSADHLATVSDSHRSLRVALSALPEDMKRALELTYFERCTHLEVANRLCAPVGTVKARIRRGVIRLRLGGAGRIP